MDITLAVNVGYLSALILPVKPATARASQIFLFHRLAACSMVCCVPQDFVLGAILFLLYCSDLQLIIESNGHCPHLYADDLLICISYCSSTYPEV